MKLRIRGDSLRLRLTQSEVQSLVDHGHVDETTTFGASRLTYALRLADLPAGQLLSARLESAAAASHILVLVAGAAGRAWATSDDVGLEATDGPLRLLVEKDFACLKPRAHEDDTDAFPNPNDTCS